VWPEGVVVDAAALTRAATVVRLRGDVLDAGHVEPCGLKRTDRGVLAGTGALGEHFDLLQAVLHALLGGGIGGNLRGERRRFA